MSLPRADIGVFDSGLGGLTVLREIRRQIPGASVLYLADTANVPYGDKPIAVVRDLALRLTDHLVEAGAKLVLMASGTSTVAGLDAARACYPRLPIVGTIEPGAKAAVALSSGAVGVLATNATAHSLAFTQAIQALDPARRVAEQGCPKFVPLVESGRTEADEAEDAACEYLAPLRAAGVESIILGCTHFPFLLPALHRAIRKMGDPAFRPTFVDPSEEAVRIAVTLLPKSAYEKETDRPPAPNSGGVGEEMMSPKPFPVPPELGARGFLDAPVHFAASADPECFRRHASALLGEPIPPVLSLVL